MVVTPRPALVSGEGIKRSSFEGILRIAGIPETPPRPRRRPVLLPNRHSVAHLSQRMEDAALPKPSRRTPGSGESRQDQRTSHNPAARKGAPRLQTIADCRYSYPVSFQSPPFGPEIVLAPLYLFPSSASTHQLSRVDDMAALEGHGEWRGFGIC